MLDVCNVEWSFVFIFILMSLGAVLERINGKHGLLDEFLTPLPLGIVGMLMLAERSFT
jgi:hypothetical protein